MSDLSAERQRVLTEYAESIRRAEEASDGPGMNEGYELPDWWECILCGSRHFEPGLIKYARDDGVGLTRFFIDTIETGDDGICLLGIPDMINATTQAGHCCEAWGSDALADALSRRMRNRRQATDE